MLHIAQIRSYVCTDVYMYTHIYIHIISMRTHISIYAYIFTKYQITWYCESVRCFSFNAVPFQDGLEEDYVELQDHCSRWLRSCSRRCQFLCRWILFHFRNSLVSFFLPRLLQFTVEGRVAFSDPIGERVKASASRLFKAILSNGKNPGCLGYIGDYTIQLWGWL